MDEARRQLPDLDYCVDPYSACKDSDMVMIITEWNEFRDLDMARVKEQVRTPILFDTRNIYDPERIRSLGFTYLSTGRPVA